MLLQLLVDDRVGRAADRPRVLAAGQERHREARRHQEAHLLAVDAARHVDADDVALLVERRAAAHAGRERAAEEDLRIEAAPHQAVVGALHDGEADVERIAERIDALALGQRLGVGAKGQGVEAVPGGVGGLQQGEVVQHVELQDLQRRFAAVGGDVDQVVPLGLQRRFADDVEVGDDEPVLGDEEARADRGLAGPALQHRADLHQLRARLLVDLACRQRHRRHRGCGRRRRRLGGGRGRRLGGVGRLQRAGRRRHRSEQRPREKEEGPAATHPKAFYEAGAKTETRARPRQATLPATMTNDDKAPVADIAVHSSPLFDHAAETAAFDTGPQGARQPPPGLHRHRLENSHATIRCLRSFSALVPGSPFRLSPPPCSPPAAAVAPMPARAAARHRRRHRHDLCRQLGADRQRHAERRRRRRAGRAGHDRVGRRRIGERRSGDGDGRRRRAAARRRPAPAPAAAAPPSRSRAARRKAS